ncbi:hypothetical protein HBI24_069150 [Parastagonospora nodorum]|nr:hypothetical protein HBH51_076100 [Parastagonospora nodorum]KAH4237858.1 hypothetical protein HBI05_126610 [Parastagonospora nodorum]KAH4238105.1 hypothetical protein HBI06_041370 [Parastagonospora nodorum]KAH4972136.1 hypothetical protein HBI78_023020 [Parastagonospora nodorum]KAH5059590.1 hypothetical protein HBH96_087910 [Parastagonospora nodorum]
MRYSEGTELFARLGELMAGRHLSLAGTEIQHYTDGDESDSGSGHGIECNSTEELQLTMADCEIRST